jgi:glycosyltransferase involved in cell wall biosynthesis
MQKTGVNDMDKQGNRTKVALVYYSSFSSFIRNDYDILSKHFDVRAINIKGIYDLPNLVREIYKCDLSFTWFAGEHAFLAVLLSRAFGKKSIVIAGGYDVACDWENNYGQFTLSLHKREMTRFALNFCDMVLPVSKFTCSEVLRWSRPKKMKLVYNGVKVDWLKEKNTPKEDDLVLTVGGISWITIKRKGIETFVRSAEFVPDARFAVIGKAMDGSIDYLRSIAPRNVQFIGWVSDEELANWYWRAKVYVQVSAYESFGLSVAEAMACECVPVVTDRGALPEVVGDTGYFAHYGDAREIAEKVKEALMSERGPRARKRVERKFPMEQREKQLIVAIRGIIG